MERNKVDIRRARLADADAIAELSGQLGYPAGPAEMRQRLAKLLNHNRAGRVLVAEAASGRVIGWVHVSINPLLEVPLRAEVNGLVVDDSNRGSGAGAELLTAAEKWARERGCKSMSVRSNVTRERAHAFYERNGYQHYKTQKAFRKTL